MSSSTKHKAPAQRRCVGVGNKHGPFRMFVLIYKCHLHTADIYNDTWDVADTPRCLLSLQLQAQSILRNLLVNIHSISFDCNKKGYFDYFLSESEKKKLQKQGVAKLIPPQFSYHSILIQLYYLCQNCLKNFSLDLLIGLLKLYCRHIYIHRISYICYYYCCLFVIPKSMTSKYSSSALPETLIQV